ncbi:hypothetical protein B0H14DRAFT_3138976 [Mycena olivaceomarginata]|nr:hypothetical protein B0H14DRAFT_3138976 [Mycena olivaceomarginata]
MDDLFLQKEHPTLSGSNVCLRILMLSVRTQFRGDGGSSLSAAPSPKPGIAAAVASFSSRNTDAKPSSSAFNTNYKSTSSEADTANSTAGGTATQTNLCAALPTNLDDFGRGKGRRNVVLGPMQPRRIEKSRRRVPMCGLEVSVATDGMLYQGRCLRLYTRPPPSLLRNRTYERLRGTARRAGTRCGCGARPMVFLLGMRLGLDRVNPVYHNTIKLAEFVLAHFSGMMRKRCIEWRRLLDRTDRCSLGPVELLSSRLNVRFGFRFKFNFATCDAFISARLGTESIFPQPDHVPAVFSVLTNALANPVFATSKNAAAARVLKCDLYLQTRVQTSLRVLSRLVLTPPGPKFQESQPLL